MKTRNAFTLAEVLITLGIIGVIAALTLPNMIQNYNQRVLETRKASVIEELTKSGTELAAESMRYPTIQDTPEFKDHTFFSTCVKTIKVCTSNYIECFKASNYVDENDSAVEITEFIDDSSECAIAQKGYVACIGSDVGVVDVNGSMGPNKFGIDVFGLFMDSTGNAGYTDMPVLGITELDCSQNKIKGIKAVKEICGCGLKEAKTMVDSGTVDCGDKSKNSALKAELLSVGCTFKNSSSISSGGETNDSSSQQGPVSFDYNSCSGKIAAIKVVKEVCGMGLKEAKEAVESGSVNCSDNAALRSGLAGIGCSVQ